MSRSGYCDDLETWSLVRWRGAVHQATCGARGQRLLIELLTALDAMPVKELIANDLESSGSYCALGVIGKARGINLSEIDPEEHDQVAEAFNIAPAMAREIVYANDEGSWIEETPAERWQRMRYWVEQRIIKGN